MDFTARDGRLLRWINGHGFVTVQQAATWLGIRYQTCHRRLKRLVDSGYLTTTRVGHSRYVFRLVKAGVIESGDDLPPLKIITMGSYNHDLQLVDLATMLERQTGGPFLTERRIRQNRGLSGVGVHGHLPDGILDLNGQKPTAIELELSTKGWRRLESIMADYAANLDIGKVWYFTRSKPLYDRLLRAAERHNFIDVNFWSNDAPDQWQIIPNAAVNC